VKGTTARLNVKEYEKKIRKMFKQNIRKRKQLKTSVKSVVAERLEQAKNSEAGLNVLPTNPD
jgi:hypothetical protein